MMTGFFGRDHIRTNVQFPRLIFVNHDELKTKKSASEHAATTVGVCKKQL
jgi:hypothetical protein